MAKRTGGLVVPKIGDRYSDWTVVDNTIIQHIDGNRTVEVECKCGIRKRFSLYYLQKNGTTCCKKCSGKQRKDSRFVPSGTKFGKWEVVSEEARISKTGHKILSVRCECGLLTERPRSTLLSGASVGCHSCQTDLKTKRYKGLCLSYFRQARNGAKRYGKILSFTISAEDAWNKFVEQQGKCALSGVDIFLHKRDKDKKQKTASLDRIDSSKGYDKDNIQWIHKTLNRMKMDLIETEFIKWCETIMEYQKRKI